MSLRFEDGRPFAQGTCPYLHRPLSQADTTNRILVNVKIDGLETQAAVDTGGTWLVCDPEIAEVLELDPDAGCECLPLRIRGEPYRGTLHRLRLTLVAEEGHDLEWEGTAFVPEPEVFQRWEWLSFLGFDCCLDRIRFAVDPVTDTFYFGPANQED
jgi:hypothetical protein